MMNMKVHDTIIIGGGPAGVAAAVYAARKKLSTLIIAEYFGGKSFVSGGIENWIGDVRLSGAELAEKLEAHVRAQDTIDVIMPDKVVGVIQTDECAFEIKTEDGGTYCSKTIIVASGARRRRLNVPGEDTFDGRGVAYCSTCDAPFFQDLDVAVIGSGNAAMESAVDLLSYAKNVHILIRGDRFKGDPITREKIEKADRAHVITRAEVTEIVGEESVTGLRYTNKHGGEARELAVEGVFIEIGSTPNTEFLGNLVATNDFGEIIINSKTGQTSRSGIFAAGDVTDDPYKQNNIAAGDGVKAALAAYSYLTETSKHSPCCES